MNQNRPTIIHGPQGCGKSRNSPALLALFGAETVIDEWDGQDPIPDGALALTNVPPPYPGAGSARIVRHGEAMALLGEAA